MQIKNILALLCLLQIPISRAAIYKDSGDRKRIEIGVNAGLSLWNTISRGQGVDVFYGSKVKDYDLLPDQGRLGFQFACIRVGLKNPTSAIGLVGSVYRHADNAIYGQHQNVNSPNLEWATFKLGFSDYRFGLYVGLENKSRRLRANVEIGAVSATMTGNFNWKYCPQSLGYNINAKGTGYYMNLDGMVRIFPGFYGELGIGLLNLIIKEKHFNPATGNTETFTVKYSDGTEPMKLDFGGMQAKAGLCFLLSL